MVACFWAPGIWDSRKDKSFGYIVDPHGKLSPLPAPFLTRSGDRADCVGPGDYELQRKEWWAGVGTAKFSQGPRKTVFDEEWAVKDKRPVRQSVL